MTPLSQILLIQFPRFNFSQILWVSRNFYVDIFKFLNDSYLLYSRHQQWEVFKHFGIKLQNVSVFPGGDCSVAALRK